jgi:chromate transporter
LPRIIDAAGPALSTFIEARRGQAFEPLYGTFFLALPGAVGDVGEMEAVAHKTVVATSDRAHIRDAVAVWAQISAAGIGGAALQLATMHRILVQERRWISEDRFFHALSYCIALPGPETQQLSIYIGWLAHRMIGGVIAGGLFILPGVICMMALTFGYVTGGNSPIGHAISLGIRPAILAVMAEAIMRFGRHVIYSRWMGALAGAAFVAAFFRVPFPIILISTAAVGSAVALLGLSGLARPSASDVHDGAGVRFQLPDHARPSLRQFICSLTFWLILWLAPPIVLLACLGPDNIFSQISLLFGKVALMAVGGDYAVVAYAAQQVVTSYHWLSAREVQEGIAMGEMVPGTIMIVTQFLGSVAAYRDPGLLPPLVAGAFGGLLATWMTFCPCFLFIMLVAPFIEGLRSNTLLNATLQAVTAGAVGMILNLSVWFGIRTLFNQVEVVHHWPFKFDVPDFSSIDLWAMALFLCAAVAVLKFKIGTVRTLLASSAAGILLVLCGVAA